MKTTIRNNNKIINKNKNKKQTNKQKTIRKIKLHVSLKII